MMHDLMVGMFWGGVLMALPPVLVGVAIAIFLVKQQRAERRAGGSSPADQTSRVA